MSEANNNTNSFDFQSSFESSPIENNNHVEHQNEVKDLAGQPIKENSHLGSNNLSKPIAPSSETHQNLESNESSSQNMDWQKVAHKLREYNRKLLKQVFRLEQELAEVDNRFNKYVEKTQNSDLLVAQQAEEIRQFQENIALLSQQTASSEKQVQTQEAVITNLSQQLELSQNQTAQIERECTLLQEEYNKKTYELVTKEKQVKELQTRLSQQQRYALQYKAELKRYQDQAAVSISKRETKKETVPSSNRNSSSRSIKPWSTSTSKTKISLPQTQPQSTPIHRIVAKASETVKTNADIAPWSTSSVSSRKASEPVKSTKSHKPKSLAAIDLPTFPRQS